jgi:hypothetical protein
MALGVLRRDGARLPIPVVVPVLVAPADALRIRADLF